ncbi:MAG TPA: hypothetical protein VMH50_03075 [Thermoleophilia bacterium]|nr:hypothetical protein [Thermoleophilia bacterium]
MRRFIADVAAFCALLALLALALDRASVLKLRRMRLDASVTTVIAGDSHTETALDDRAIPGAVNISRPAEHLLFTFEKLQLVLPRNPGVRTVVLGLGFHNFSAFFERFGRRRAVVRLSYQDAFPTLDAEARWFLLLHDPAGLLLWAGAIVRSEAAGLLHAERYADYGFWGHPYRSEGSDLSDTAVAGEIALHFYRGRDRLQAFASREGPYLDRIVRLCAERRVRLVLINTPLNPRYAERVPPPFVRRYDDALRPIRAAGVALLDYHALALPDDWYGDGDHLNARGAASFSRMVAADLARLP